MFYVLAYPIDFAALAIFLLCWTAYEPLLAFVSRGRPPINDAMVDVRLSWMRRSMRRPVRIMDTNLMGHMLNSASFFASTNLLLIAAVAGLLVGGEAVLNNLEGLSFTPGAPLWLLQSKIALVVFALAKGLLDFVWAIRQMNYSLALLGAGPEYDSGADLDTFAKAIADVLNPAFAAFNHGVRAYYFALAAAAWILSPMAMALGAAAASAVLLRRQIASPAAAGIRAANEAIASERPRQEDAARAEARTHPDDGTGRA
jgi:uncharacterized membrane protein